jgi:putative membrane protein
MKILKITMMALLGSVLFLQACKKDNDNNNNTLDKTSFVMQASSSNMFEIQAGQMAMQKGMNDAVKAYGQHMVADHTKAANEMKVIAQSKGITVSDQLMDKQQQQLNILAPLTGANFDKAFAALMIQSHQETIVLFTNAASNVNDNDLKSFAKAKLPTLRDHLEDAQDLNETVNK